MLLTPRGLRERWASKRVPFSTPFRRRFLCPLRHGLLVHIAPWASTVRCAARWLARGWLPVFSFRSRVAGDPLFNSNEILDLT